MAQDAALPALAGAFACAALPALAKAQIVPRRPRPPVRVTRAARVRAQAARA